LMAPFASQRTRSWKQPRGSQPSFAAFLAKVRWICSRSTSIAMTKRRGIKFLTQRHAPTKGTNRRMRRHAQDSNNLLRPPSSPMADGADPGYSIIQRPPEATRSQPRLASTRKSRFWQEQRSSSWAAAKSESAKPVSFSEQQKSLSSSALDFRLHRKTFLAWSKRTNSQERLPPAILLTVGLA